MDTNVTLDVSLNFETTYTYDEVLAASIKYFNGDELAANVFVDKYALKDSNKNYYELTPDDMHRRLAKEFARIEAKYPNPMSEDEIFGLLKDFKYIVPQGSPMSGIGNPFQVQSIGNCFVAGTKIFTTNRGVVNIENVQLNDYVPTHNKNIKKVTQIHKNKLAGRQLFDIKCFRSPKITVTENHKFLSITQEQIKWNENPQWNEVKYLRAGDYIAIPNVADGNNNFTLNIAEVLKSCELTGITNDRDYSIEENNDRLKLITHFKNGHTNLKNGKKYHQEVNKFWKIDNNFAFFLGLWLGDGCIFTRDKLTNVFKGITFTFGKHEEELIEFVTEYGQELFGIVADVNYHNVDVDGSVQIVFYGAAIANVFNKLFGRGCRGKRLANFVYSTDKQFIEHLISGLVSSDGTITSDGSIRVVLTNRSLIEDIYHLARKSGIVLGISYCVDGDNTRLDFPKNSYLTHLIKKSYTDNRLNIARLKSDSKLFVKVINGTTFVKINNKIKNNETPEFVYTFGVEEDHSYSVEGLICQNCFVLEPPYDSYGGILKTDQELVQLAKRRAGIGFDISKIRPKGLSTKNAAKTTDGIAVFMERYSNSCREVAQAGRRGALLLAISVHHPEVETFINIKRDLKKVTGANISIQLTDEFMQAVKKGKDYEQRWPVDSSTPLVSKYVKAKDIWNQIINAAWTSAEPGLLFIDNHTSTSPADVYQSIDPDMKSTCTNPCQPAYATLLTPEKISTMGEIKVGDTIWSGKNWTKVINKVATGIKPVYKYKTTAGIFYGTENHRVLSGGEKIEVKDADSIDLSLGKIDTPLMSKNFVNYVMDGLVIGDGMMHKASNNLVTLLIGENDSDYFHDIVSDLIIEHKPGIKKEAYLVKTSIKSLDKTYNRTVPDKYKFGSLEERCGFLRGLYSANGSVVANRVTLKATSFKIIEDVQIILSSLGIASYFTTNKSHEVEFENGTYECKESYDLNIGTLDGRIKFKLLIGFIQSEKQLKLIESCNCNPSSKPFKQTYDIVEKEYIGDELVYDITVDADEHTYWTGGLSVSNCGEIYMGVDSCRLLVVNLFSFVTNPFTESSTFNFTEFAEVVVKAQRLMDDIVDLELECIDKIIKKVKSDPEPENIKRVEIDMWERFKKNCINGRRTGLGITALGDTLAALNIRYGSDESVKMTEKIYKALTVNAYKSSAIMAVERGAFPLFDLSLEENNSFIKSVCKASQEFNDLYKVNGRRNIALTTTAPTGSLSTLTQTTSGIEPAFLLKYDRFKKVNPSDQSVKVDRVDAVGDSWQKFTVYHHNFKRWMDVTGNTEIEDSPYWKATSNDVDWNMSVKLQAVAQKWIDHSISKTCNIPKEASKELVAEIYMKAWEEGCKGFTVYRDGCRDGVLVASSEASQTESDGRPNKIQRSLSPKRPDSLPCDIHHPTVNGQKWTVLVGLFHGQPYEVFLGLSKSLSLSSKHTQGTLTKSGKGNYTLSVLTNDQPIEIKNVIETFDNPESAWATRMISTSLRHGVPVEFICEQLSKDGFVTDVNKALARILRKYTTENLKSKSTTCMDCNSTDLMYQEGCLKCLSCGSSKCG